MCETKIIFHLVITLSLTEFSTQQSNRYIPSENARVEMLAAARRGDMKGFLSGIAHGGLLEYDSFLRKYSRPKLREIEDVMEEKMRAIDKLITLKLAVPQSKEQPKRYHFNITLLSGTEIITQLSLNMEVLEHWKFHETPLQVICSLPEVEPRIVKHLLDEGLDINERTNSSTPLENAISSGNLVLVEFLVKKGANPNSTYLSDTRKPLKQFYHSFIRLFSPNHSAILDGTKLYHNALLSAIDRGNVEIINYLISLGVDVNMSNQSLAVLYDPINDGKTEIVELLLKNGIDVNGRDLTGATALHYAADVGDPVMARLLLNKGAEVTAIDNFGWTPLHVAAFTSENVSLVELLIKYGASVEAKTNEGFTPLVLAVANSLHVQSNHSFFDCLGEAIASNFTLRVSCKLDKITSRPREILDIISLLCKKGSKVDHKDDILGWSALHWACVGDEEAARLLVAKCGASQSARSNTGFYPGHIAKYFRGNTTYCPLLSNLSGVSD